MAGNKYVVNNGGRMDEARANQISAGAADAGKLIALNSTGIVDSTMLPAIPSITKGVATLVAGTATITTAAAATGMVVMLSHNAPGGDIGILVLGAIVAGVSFVINSSSPADTSTVSWMILS
jgi:hypothetical protein